MNRRHFLSCSAAAAMTGAALPAAAYSPMIYAPQTWRDLRAGGGTVIVNFRASWSLTCQIKEEILTTLLNEEPAFGQLTFLDVDWDTFGRSQWTERLKVRRRSTLLAMRGGEEIARLVNTPYTPPIRDFLQTALDA